MRRATLALLVTPVLLATTLFTTPLAAQLCGDCNQDGQINVLDALAAARHAAGLITLVGTGFTACDVDSGGTVNILDALAVAQAAAGLTPVLTCAFTPPAVFDIRVTSTFAYYNFQPVVPPDPLLCFFDVEYENLGAMPAEAILTTAELDVTPGAPGAPFTQTLTLDLDRSGIVPVGATLTVSHRKQSGAPLPYTGTGSCSATGVLTLTYDVGGTPQVVVVPGIAISCVY